MFQIRDLSVELHGKKLFSRVDFDMSAGARYGLVGANGSGKTTLFRLLSGALDPSSGTITLPTKFRLGLLKQDALQYEPIKIKDVVMMGNRTLWDAIQAKEEIITVDCDLTTRDAEKLAELEVIIEREGGYEAEGKIANFLEGLGIEESQQDKPLKTLSSGYRLRVLLAQLLFDQPDVLLLDEPTNYLDILSISWLEKYLKNYAGTCIISSHDRTFLNRVVTDILDVDYGTITVYRGDFDDFWERKLEDVALRSKREESIGRRKKGLQTFIDKYRAKSSKARQAQSKMHLVRKLEKEQEDLSLAPTSRQYPSFGFIKCRKSGPVPLTIEGISKNFGKKTVLNKVSFSVNAGEKVAIVGANGIGKSTLLEIMMGNLAQDSGEVQFGHHTYPTYFPQNIERFMPAQNSVIEWLTSQNLEVPETAYRSALGKMLFSGDDVDKKVGNISGGERARLYFAKMMLQKANLIVLDEPTNHLDMESTEGLELALNEYDGTVILVSHNRHFIDKVATRIIEVSHRGIYDHLGSYEEYAKKRENDPLLAKKKGIKKPKKTRSKSPLPKIQEKCQKLEIELALLEEKAADPNLFQNDNLENYYAIIAQKQQIEENLMSLYMEWEKLSNNE